MSSFRVHVDRDLCQGHGVCENEAPDVFTLEKHATTITLRQAEPDETQRKAVEAAVKYCPTHALRVEEININQAKSDAFWPQGGPNTSDFTEGEDVK